MRYEIIDYADVWGNPHDGFHINEEDAVGVISLEEDALKKDIVKALIDFGYFHERVTADMIEAEDLGYFIEIEESAVETPICRLQLIGESEVAEDEL
jgi:hypothetical protein